MYKLPPLSSLRCFEVAARHSSFTAAAKELLVTHSAISHQIRQLEDWLGLKLFDRKGKSMSLTAEGRDLANTLQRSFGDIDTVCRRLTLPPNRKTITVAALPSVATCWIIPLLSDFWNKHPDIQVKLVYTIHGMDLDFNEIDLAIAYGKPPFGNTKPTRFLDGTYVPMCSKEYLKNMGPLAKSADLLDKILLHDNEWPGWPDWFKAADVPVPREIPGPVFEDFNMLRSAALAGHGIALSPPALLKDDLKAGRLVILSDVAVHSDKTYYIIEPISSSPNYEPVEKFKHWILDTAQQEFAG